MRKFYVAKCSKCHKLYDPAKYNDADWSHWMERMTRKAKLNAEQSAALTEYLRQTYRTPQS